MIHLYFICLYTFSYQRKFVNVSFSYLQALDLVKQPKVAQILSDEKSSNRRGSRTSLNNSEHEQPDEVSFYNEF